MAMILVVDDHRGVADAAVALVGAGGHEARAVYSGGAALAFVRSRPVDLVVLDVSMPDLSGLDVLRTLRAEGKLPGLPVVMFSADRHARDEALRLGAAAFVCKSDAENLLHAVAEQLRNAECGMQNAE